MAQATKTAMRPQTMPTPEPLVENLPAPRPRPQGTGMAIIPQNWQEITAIASAICRARMAPKTYLDKDGNPQAEKVAIAIMHGLEVGFTPMASLQSLAVINGMPSVYGDGLLALIRSSGLLEDIEETMEWDKHGPVAATCKMWRKGEKTPSIQTYAREDAMKAKLWGKPGPWTDHPQRMLQWRARGWCGRDKFADVLRGLRLAEEVQDMVDITPHGHATVVPDVPAQEPKREDYDKQNAAGVSSDPAGGGAASSGGPGGGDAVTTGGGDSKPEAAARQSSSSKVTDVEPEPASEPEPTGGSQAEPSDKIPDDEPMTFEKYTTYRDLIDFSDQWLSDQARTAAQAQQWHDFYRKQLEHGVSPKYGNKSVAEAINDLLAKYGEVIAREQ